MTNINLLDEALYNSIYRSPRVGNFNEIWNNIKNDPQVLREAVQITEDKYNKRNTVKGLTICDSILINYKSIDEIAYMNLIDAIYTNKDIARIVVDGASTGGFSFLFMSLWNHNLKLTNEQKDFAIDEAMNKIGTTRYQQTELLSNTQAHGVGIYDIRYQILKNPNWSFEEKKKLVMDFWNDAKVYDETLDQWEWGIINNCVNFKNYHTILEKDTLYEFTYERLLNIYKDKAITEQIWNEIQFCKQMHKLRPQQWELEIISKKKVLNYI